jgi:hypothetical protein
MAAEWLIILQQSKGAKISPQAFDPFELKAVVSVAFSKYLLTSN